MTYFHNDRIQRQSGLGKEKRVNDRDNIFEAGLAIGVALDKFVNLMQSRYDNRNSSKVFYQFNGRLIGLTMSIALIYREIGEIVYHIEQIIEEENKEDAE